MLIIVSALRNEIEKVVKHFKLNLIEKRNKRITIWENKDIFILTTGIGWNNLRKSLNYFYNEYLKDKNKEDLIFLLIGFAGAIKDNLKIGDIIIPSRIYTEKYGKKEFLKIGLNLKTKKNDVLYDENKIFTREEKIKLKDKYPDVAAVDMESFAFTNYMIENKISNFLIVKSITDKINSNLPRMKSFKYSVKRISTIFKIGIKEYIILLNFYFNMNKASKSLKDFLVKFYEKGSYKYF